MLMTLIVPRHPPLRQEHSFQNLENNRKTFPAVQTSCRFRVPPDLVCGPAKLIDWTWPETFRDTRTNRHAGRRAYSRRVFRSLLGSIPDCRPQADRGIGRGHVFGLGA